jgi:hypothetical protein
MHTLVTRKPRTHEKSRVRGSSVFILPQNFRREQPLFPKKSPVLRVSLNAEETVTVFPALFFIRRQAEGG